MHLHRKHFDDLAIIATRVIKQNPKCADLLMQELIMWCEGLNTQFKRKLFIKAVHERLSGCGRLPKGSSYLPLELPIEKEVQYG